MQVTGTGTADIGPMSLLVNKTVAVATETVATPAMTKTVWGKPVAANGCSGVGAGFTDAWGNHTSNTAATSSTLSSDGDQRQSDLPARAAATLTTMPQNEPRPAAAVLHRQWAEVGAVAQQPSPAAAASVESPVSPAPDSPPLNAPTAVVVKTKKSQAELKREKKVGGRRPAVVVRWAAMY